MRDVMRRAQQAAGAVRVAYEQTVDDRSYGRRGTFGRGTTVNYNTTQNITTVQDDPRLQALQWGRWANKAFSGTGGV